MNLFLITISQVFLVQWTWIMRIRNPCGTPMGHTNICPPLGSVVRMTIIFNTPRQIDARGSTSNNLCTKKLITVTS